MIAQIQDLPASMIGFRASGEVSKEDFEPVLAAVEQKVAETGKLNYLLVLDNSPADFTMGAWLQDALLGLKNITKWNRAAIVTDSEAVIKFTNAFSLVMPGEFKGFHKSEMAEAVDWVAEIFE